MAWQNSPTDDELRAAIGRYSGWFQGWEIRPGVSVPGPNNIDAVLKRARVPQDLSGRRVLDIGANDGCVAFECERRGATVVATDIVPRAASGFDVLRDVLGSEVQWDSASIYDLDHAKHGQFDVVICFGVIYHLRYPLLGIDRLRSVATGDVFVESHVIDRNFRHPRRWYGWLKEKEQRISSVPLWRHYRARELNDVDSTNIFGPNTYAVVAALDDVGITAEVTDMWSDRAAFAGRVRPGPSRQHESYEAFHATTARLMGVDPLEEALFPR